MKPSMVFLLVTAVCLFACSSSHPDSADLTADLTDSHFETETEEAVDAAMDEPVDLVSPDGFLDGVSLDETKECQHALTVMSFNLRTGLAFDGDNAWKYREPIVLNVLAEHAPDLFGTQEGLIFQLMAIEDNLPEYDWLGIGRNGTEFEEFCAIFYKR